MAVLSVPIMLDKQRNLRFGFKAILALEKIYKKGFLEIFQGLQANPMMEDVKNLFWAGLMHEDKDLTPDAVVDIIDDLNLGELMTTLTEAVEGAISEKNLNSAEEKAENPTAE